MGVPATGGKLVTTLDRMEIGDYIDCSYMNSATGSPGTFSKLGTSSGSGEIPLSSNVMVNGKFYLIKVDKGLLIADRCIQDSITWLNLNSAGFIEGDNDLTIITSNDGEFLKVTKIRTIGGGISFDNTKGIAFPFDNEWDIYITNKDFGNGLELDSIWNWSYYYTMTRDTTTTSTNKVTRGKSSVNALASYNGNANASYGFRPVFEFKENV